MFTFNTTPHTSTNYTPFELLYGAKPRLPSSIHNPPEPQYTYDNYAQELKKRLQSTQAIARENLQEKKEKSKQYYDKCSKVVNFNVGDKVLLYDQSVRRGRSRKLCSPYVGPYEIIAKSGPVNYTIKQGRRFVTVHSDRLKHFIT